MIITNNTNHIIYIDDVAIAPKSSYECEEHQFNTVNIHCDIGSCIITTEYSKRTFSDFGNIKVVELEDKDSHGLHRLSIVSTSCSSDIDDLKLRDATSEEVKCVQAYVESISKSTGVTFDDAMDDNTQFVNILGAEYKIIRSDMVQHPKLERAAGYCDFNVHTIVVDEFKNPDQDATEDMEAYKNKVLRHELVHAFLRESGLSTNSWADNEEIVDWIAIQAPKIFKVFKDLELL